MENKYIYVTTHSRLTSSFSCFDIRPALLLAVHVYIPASF